MCNGNCKDLIVLDDLENTKIKVSDKLYEKLYSRQRIGVPGVYFMIQTRIKIDTDGNIIDVQFIEELI